MNKLTVTCKCVECGKTQEFVAPLMEMPFHDCFGDGVPVGPMILHSAKAE